MPAGTIKTMTCENDIARLVTRIAREFRPERVVLFGSHASGTQRSDSDVDLLVVMSFKGSRSRQAALIRAALPASVPIDLVVRTPAEVGEGMVRADPLAFEAMRHGRVLYQAAA